jgi:hypothetical protein
MHAPLRASGARPRTWPLLKASMMPAVVMLEPRLRSTFLPPLPDQKYQATGVPLKKITCGRAGAAAASAAAQAARQGGARRLLCLSYRVRQVHRLVG